MRNPEYIGLYFLQRPIRFFDYLNPGAISNQFHLVDIIHEHVQGHTVLAKPDDDRSPIGDERIPIEVMSLLGWD